MRRFQAVQAAIDTWPAPAPTPAGELRTVDAIAAFNSGASTADLVSLIRQELRRIHGRTATAHPLSVPSSAPWPTATEWSRAHVLAIPDGDTYRLSAKPWTPAWLPDGESGVDTYAVREDRRRPDEQVMGDPFLTHIDPNITTYLTAGQRQAVRTVLSSPPDTTVVVNLPTGSGKTLAAIAPALLNSDVSRTIVVVPTTTLALDHERRLAEQLHRDPDTPSFAYHGGLSPEDKNRLRTEFRSGETPVLFTSPESLVGGLSWMLDDVAAHGRLGYFVVDEAHIVSEWGDEFRPEFQAMAGIRRHLRRRMIEGGHQPFRTVLMTGTLTESTLDTLLSIFSDHGRPVELVSSVMIRPEPAYWIAPVAASSEERDQHLLDAVASLPRPLLIYTTLVNPQAHRPRALSTTQVQRLLRDAGYQRVARVDGGTSPTGRRNVINGLRGDPDRGLATRFDIVVASSAFGLGVDINDVRTVLHACIPETVDRYYQEVGRAGRDGRASVSVVVPGPDDREIAEGLNWRKMISAERGWERWQAMWQNRSPSDDLGQQRHRVRLTARPPRIKVGDSDYNAAWNLRTLSMMARAGMIRFDEEPPPRPDPPSGSADETSTAEQPELDDYLNAAVVELRQGDLDQANWSSRLERVRSATEKQNRRSLSLMNEVLAGRRCVGEIFADAYRIGDTGNPNRVGATPSCGGCPACRRESRPPYCVGSPIPGAAQHPVTALSAKLKALAQPEDAGDLLLISVDPNRPDLQRRIAQLVKLLVPMGIRQLVADPKWTSTPTVHEAHRLAPERYLFVSDALDPASPHVPTLVITNLATTSDVAAPDDLTAGGLPLKVTVLCEGLRDPEKPTVPLDQLRSVYRLDELLERL